MSQVRAIPLHHQPHDAGYRLLELPPELQSLLESDPAPVLTLGSDADSSAVLRTPDAVYALRQKNTSNALLLLAPQPAATSSDVGLAAIATVHETVELDAAPQPPAARAVLKDTGSRGKWHEKFAKGR